MKLLKHLSGFIFILLMFPAIVYGGPRVSATVDRTSIGPGESLTLNVTIEGGDGDVDTSPVRDFKVISRESTNSINMVNGKFSQKLIYNFVLIPFRQGRLTIPSLPVTIGGKTYYTKPISINVSGVPSETKDNSPDIFVKAKVSNSNPYLNQYINYTFKLYQAVRIANAQFDPPDFAGFNATELSDRKTYTAVVSGRRYRVTELSYVLLPLETGDLMIEPGVLSCDIVKRSTRRRSIFDDPFFGFGGASYEPRVFKTRPLKVSVKPLPSYKGDKNFSSLVGKFDIKFQIEKTKMKVGDSVTLSITIQGQGNIKDALEPGFGIPDALKAYKDNPEEDIKLGMEGYKGKKIFRTALVPVKSGTYTIGPVELTYFDVFRGRYVTKKTQTITLDISPAPTEEKTTIATPSPSGSLLFKKKVEFKGRDILPLKENISAIKNQKEISFPMFAGLLALPAIIYLIIFGFVRLTKESDAPSYVMAKRAKAQFKKAASRVNDTNAFLSCLYSALISAILSKAGVNGESITYKEAEKILAKSGYPEDKTGKVIKMIEEIESARFGGTAINKPENKKLLARVEKIIKELI